MLVIKNAFEMVFSRPMLRRIVWTRTSSAKPVKLQGTKFQECLVSKLSPILVYAVMTATTNAHFLTPPPPPSFSFQWQFEKTHDFRQLHLRT